MTEDSCPLTSSAVSAGKDSQPVDDCLCYVQVIGREMPDVMENFIYLFIRLVLRGFHTSYKVLNTDTQNFSDFDSSLGRGSTSQLYPLTDISKAKSTLLRKIRPTDSFIEMSTVF